MITPVRNSERIAARKLKLNDEPKLNDGSQSAECDIRVRVGIVSLAAVRYECDRRTGRRQNCECVQFATARVAARQGKITRACHQFDFVQGADYDARPMVRHNPAVDSLLKFF